MYKFLPDNVELFSEYTAFLAGLLCPNGLRKFFGLNNRRRCCGGVAHELTSTSDVATTCCLLPAVDALPFDEKNFRAVCCNDVDSGDVKFCRD